MVNAITKVVTPKSSSNNTNNPTIVKTRATSVSIAGTENLKTASNPSTPAKLGAISDNQSPKLTTASQASPRYSKGKFSNFRRSGTPQKPEKNQERKKTECTSVCVVTVQCTTGCEGTMGYREGPSGAALKI